MHFHKQVETIFHETDATQNTITILTAGTTLLCSSCFLFLAISALRKSIFNTTNDRAALKYKIKTNDPLAKLN